MLGLFGTLNLGGRSLAVQQQATEVAGQNLANVNNPAYARQRLNVQTSISLNTPVGQQGTGIDAVSIVQIRDAILDNQIQSEGSVTGSLDAQQKALQNVEAALGEQISAQSATATGAGTSANGLAAALSKFFSAAQSLSGDPSNPSLRQAFIQSAQQLSGQFNQISSGLDGITSNLNTGIQDDVTSANQDLQDIAALNKQIIQATVSGGTANDLMDLRQQKIEDLGTKVNITTVHQPNGGLDVSIGGVTMISGSDQQDSLETFDAGGGQILVRAQTAGTTLNLSGGSMEGKIDVRDGALKTLKDSVNTLASQVISQVNGIYVSGFDLNGGTNQNFFTGTDAASIGINSTLGNDTSALQTSGTSGLAGDNSIILALAQLQSQKSATLNNQTFSQNYAQTVGSLGTSLASVNDQIANNAAVTQMLTTQRASVSGVSVDEEMTNLIQFQKAYQASAELISTINQMLSTVINMKN